LLAESRALIHFTEHEGYGLPPVESIMAGTPPVYSLIPVTREVMGDTGWPFSNDDEEAFRHALTRALETPAPVIAGWAEDLQRRHRWTDIGQRLVDAMQYYGGGAGE
ncbi:MAG TPA: glycosyltransferase, partial [Kiritimatiellia bacterium]|nr:glycosyltransferase [Kiritimatiellia bacterium]